MRIIPAGGLGFIVGLALLVAAILVLGSHHPSGTLPIPFSLGTIHIPYVFRTPLAFVLVCAGIYCIWYELRFLWRKRDVIPLVFVLGILFYLGYVAMFEFLR